MACKHDCITYQSYCFSRKCKAVVLRHTCRKKEQVLCEDCEAKARVRDEQAGEQLALEGVE